MHNIAELAAKLNHTAQTVVNTTSFEAWLTGPLHIILPHQGMLCGQSIAHAGGYTAVYMHSVGVPETYLQTILCHGNNVRSPVFANLMQAKGKPQFFCALRDGEAVTPGWLQRFQMAGWNTLMGLSYTEGEGDDRVLTTAGFYNVQHQAECKMGELQRTVMPVLHGILTRLLEVTHQSPRPSTLTPAETELLPLLAQGKTNKELGKTLNKSPRTIEHLVSKLLVKFNAINRVELVAKLATPEYR